MNYQNFLLISTFLTLSIFPAQAKVYSCLFKVGETEEKFQFDVVKDQQGMGGTFGDYGYFLGIKDKKISIKIQNSKTAAQVQSSFEVVQDNIELSQTPGWDMTCVVDNSRPKVAGLDPTPAPEVKKLVLDEETPLEKYQAGIDFIASSQLKVVYNVSTAKDRMRSIIFQKGRLYTTDDDVKRDLNGNWCIFQVQLELDQDTVIDEGHVWQTVQYKTLRNSSSHVVYGYSFIDPAQGKVSQRFKRYKPFNLACQVKKDEVFNLKMWRQITGDRIKLRYNP